MEKEKKINPEFDLVSQEDSDISKEDFALVDSSTRSHEQKFQTRPTTFLKDSVKRFAKNKSSLVASGILGVLILMAIIVPIADPYKAAPAGDKDSTSYSWQQYLLPKLFDKNDAGFWDGTKKLTNISVDTSKMPLASTEEEKQQYWWPDKAYTKEAISKKEFSDLQYEHSSTTYGVGGYLQAGFSNGYDDEYAELFSRQMTVDFDISVNNYVSKFEVYDLETLQNVEKSLNSNIKGSDSLTGPKDCKIDDCALYFNYKADDEIKSILIIDYAEKHNIGGISQAGAVEEKVNITEKIKAATTETVFKNSYFSVRIKNDNYGTDQDGVKTCFLLKSLVFETESTVEEMKTQFADSSILDASELVRISAENENKRYQYWAAPMKDLYCSQVVYCSFVYDTYEAVFGTRKYTLESGEIDTYRAKGWLDWDYNIMVDPITEELYIDEESFYFNIKDYEKCPITHNVTIDEIVIINIEEIAIVTEVCLYKYHGYDHTPKFLVGTDERGNDLFKYVFAGLRTSLILGLITFIVCFLFGLAWGAISGYFGGTVDLIMERITDILSGVPWIVVMTLAIMKWGSTLTTFALALCFTGWIGTAATTRTQFYRFRGREYVLASRTLGANDFRLIFKHILPNAMGTIITSAVLMIPSVIFSEATISYLGLGLQNLSSLGVILSDNQKELTSNSFLLIFPSVIIALLMISFNLFGNGLRDAVNPSLKGEGE